MGSGRGDRNQPGWSSYADSTSKLQWGPVVVTGISGTKIRNSAAKCVASMGSGRGDRNQLTDAEADTFRAARLQWGPVVVTGIRHRIPVVAGAGLLASMGSGRGDRNQLPPPNPKDPDA